MNEPPTLATPGDGDRLYAEPLGEVAGFRFDERVADVFDDMITRSVPGYATVVGMSGALAAHFAVPGTRLYDLGCALGATALSMAQAVTVDDCRIVAVDAAPAMVQRLNRRFAREASPLPVDVVCGDICEIELASASVVAMNYTLQFVPRERRDALVARIRAALVPGGVLILSEKIRFDDPPIDALVTALHHDFKRRRGYSELEIAQKRAALDNVLVSETVEAHRERLRKAGFARVETWYQCLNFASLIAIA